MNDTGASYDVSINPKDIKAIHSEPNDKYIEQFIHECVLPKHISSQYIKKQALLKQHFQQTKHNTKNTNEASHNEIGGEPRTNTKNDSPPKDKHKKKRKGHHQDNNNPDSDNSDKDQDDLNNMSFKANSYFRSDKAVHHKQSVVLYRLNRARKSYAKHVRLTYKKY